MNFHKSLFHLLLHYALFQIIECPKEYFKFMKLIIAIMKLT